MSYVKSKCADDRDLRDLFRSVGQKSRAQVAQESRAAQQRLQMLVHCEALRYLCAEPITDPAYARYRQHHLPAYAVRPIDVAAHLDAGRPILSRLDYDTMGTEHMAACGLLLGLFGEAVRARRVVGDMAQEPLTHIIADEVGAYATSSLVSLIDEGRKYHASVIAIAQGLASFAPKLSAALVRVNLLAIFRVTPLDAQTLAGDLFAVDVAADGSAAADAADTTAPHPSAVRLIQADAVNKLPVRQCYVRPIKVWPSARRLEMADMQPLYDAAARRDARRASAQRYGSDAAMVTAELACRARWLDDALYRIAYRGQDASDADVSASGDTDAPADDDAPPRNRFD